MASKFFFSKDFIKKLILLSFAILLILPASIFTICALGISLFLLLFRKNKVIFKNTPSNTTEIILSPVAGKVVAIATDKSFLEIKVPILGPYGLYMPLSAQVAMYENFQIEDKNFTKNAKQYSLVFRNKLGATTAVDISNSMFGTEAHVWLRTGDKARSSANFGYMPLGGVVKVNLPEESNLLVREGEKVLAGSTILAGIKG